MRTVTNRKPLLRKADACRRNEAACLYEVLRLETIPGLSYDGDFTVIAGPVTASFGHCDVRITFVDTWSDATDPGAVVIVPGPCTYGTLADIVTALVKHLAVA